MPDPLVILGDEQSRFDPTRADGGLPPLPGVQSFCVFRASRDTRPDTGYGWTYHHHIDMACWHGRLYVAWNTCEKDEDRWPSRELYATSLDGALWTDPRELFPQGVSAPLRMYFYLARGKLLAIASMRLDTEDTREELKTGLVVREITPRHELGEVFALRPSPQGWGPIRQFETADDATFVDACRDLLADRVYLEQQDLGNLLGERRMTWHHAASWPGGKLPGQTDAAENVKWTFGKALSFFDRADGATVGLCKMGWTVVSQDRGETWSAPAVPATLVTGKAKVFAAVARTGERLLVYNPTPSQRWPLVLVASRDGGTTFDGMRVVQGELPRQRYEGRFRSVGPQYVRGISKWSDDGSRAAENAQWLVYSMSKEDIWVSRVPLPIRADADAPIDDDFSHARAGPSVAGWNTYRPKWATIAIEGRALRLVGTDPYDYASATRVFGSRVRATIELRLSVPAFDRERIEIDVLSASGVAAARIALLPDGSVAFGDRLVGNFAIGAAFALRLSVDAGTGLAALDVDGRPLVEGPLLSPVDEVHRLTIRTGAFRNVGGKNPVEAGTDAPASPVGVDVFACKIS